MATPESDCARFRAELLELADGALPTPAFEAHREECARCRRELESIARFETRVREATPPLDDALRARFRERFFRAERTRTVSLGRRRRWIPYAATAAIVLVAVALFGPWGVRESNPPVGRVEMAAATRAGPTWQPGDRFRLRIELAEFSGRPSGPSNPGSLAVLHLDAERAVAWVFPMPDGAGGWSRLGHPERPFPAGTVVSLPPPEFGELTVDNVPGPAAFLVFVADSLPEAAREGYRARLEAIAREPRSAADIDASLDRVAAAIRAEHGFVRVLRYRVEENP